MLQNPYLTYKTQNIPFIILIFHLKCSKNFCHTCCHGYKQYLIVGLKLWKLRLIITSTGTTRLCRTQIERKCKRQRNYSRKHLEGLGFDPGQLSIYVSAPGSQAVPSPTNFPGLFLYLLIAIVHTATDT